jgi:lipid II:glycine glycyltransferase (peptidoglycan interpeptide bridge formation enzyme)
MVGEFSMTTTSGWNEWSGTPDEWEAALLSFDDANIYQSGRWGLHRSKFGWKVTHLAQFSNGIVTSLAQILSRRVTPLVTVCWIPGGPVGDLKMCDSTLISCIKKLFTTPVLYIHMSAMTQYRDELASSLQAHGWGKPPSMLNSDKTLIYDVYPSATQRREKLSKNWSRNLSRGEQRELTVSEWVNPTAHEIASLTNEMNEYKHLQTKPQDLDQTTESLLQIFRNDILVVKCTNKHGELLALRGAVKLGHKAFDMFAAATPAGRKEYASNLCFWKLIELCERDGITHYDLSGVDPEESPGVYNFKKGIGATDFTYLGEWSYSRPRIVRTVVSRMIARRMRPE